MCLQINCELLLLKSITVSLVATSLKKPNSDKINLKLIQ